MRSATLLGILLVSSQAFAGSQIIDTAGFFSKDVAAACEKRLSEVEAVTGVPMLVETFNTASKQKFRSAAEKDQFFERQLRQVALDRNAQGIIVVLHKTPGRVQIDFHKNLYSQGHTYAEHANMRNMMLVFLKDKQNDKALAALTTEIERFFLPKAEVASPPVGAVPLPPVPPSAATAPVKHEAPQPVVQPEPAKEGHSSLFWVVAVIVLGITAFVIVMGCIALFSSSKSTDHLYGKAQTPKKYPKSLWSAVKCPGCGVMASVTPCEQCGTAVPEPPRPTPPPAPPSTTVVRETHVHNSDGGGSDLLTGYILGGGLSHSEPSHHHSSDDSSSYSPPSYSSDDSGSSGGGFDFGGGGSDFSGGSGGDF